MGLFGGSQIQNGGEFENWKVSDLSAFHLGRDVPVCEQPKAVLVQNCYMAVSLGLQPKKLVDEYAKDILQSSHQTGKARVG